MKHLLSFLAFALLLLIASCGPDTAAMQEKITSLEKKLVDQQKGSIDQKVAAELIRSYREYAAKYRDDSLAPAYLYHAGEIFMNTNRAMDAINIFDSVRMLYPEHKKAADCLFLKAFIFENMLNDTASARKFYTEFIQAYPDDDFTDDARALVKNLGKSPEELVKEFEKKK